MNDEHWTILQEEWATEVAIAKSKSASESRKSDPDGKGMHNHSAGPQIFLKIEYKMMVVYGCYEPPSFTDLVRKTHTRKDGTFIHHRAQSIVLEVKEDVSQMTTDDGSPNGVSKTASPCATPRILLNQEYIKRSQTRQGRIYGIGSIQYQDINPSESVSTSLKPNLDIEMRIFGLETKSEAVNNIVEVFKTDMVTVKGEITATRTTLEAILKLLQPSSVPAATTTNPTSTEAAYVPTAMPTNSTPTVPPSTTYLTQANNLI